MMVRNRRSLGRKVSPKKMMKVGGKMPAAGQAAEKSASMQVVVRVRPPNEKEQENNSRRIIDVVNENGLVFDPKESEDLFFYHGSSQSNRDVTKRKNKNSEFVFDRVFDETVKNHEVYEYTTREILKALFDGYNCSVFAYGATGSGKTFTMLGDKGNPGIAYLMMVELYNRVRELLEEYEFDIRVSYLEVYNENVRDLLQPGSKHLHLREDSASGVTIVNLTICKITSAEELFARLTEGNMNRTQHPTDANSESSRSHAVFQTYIHSRLKKTKQQKLVKLSMIDLAGSEKASATGGRGVRFAEGQNINRSLLALGNCINSLAAGSKHVPYRDSKLTRLLKDSLGGNCRTVMIANISPCSNMYEDTHRTLKYAERAKMIKLKVVRNVLASGFSRMQYDKLMETLQSENMALKAEVSQLKDRLKMFEAGPSSVVDSTGDANAAETEETRDVQAAESTADPQAAGSPTHVCDVVCALPSTSSLGTDCLPPEPVCVPKCDVEVQVSFPAREERGESKLVSSITAVFAAKKEMNKMLSCEERGLKRLQWKCYRRLVTTRRLNSLGNDHKELEKKEARMRSTVRAALRQAQEHYNSIRRVWQQLEAHHDSEVAALADARAAEDPALDTLVAKCRLEVTVQNLEVQAEHMKELLKVMHAQSEKDDAIVRTLCGCLKSHHMLLKAHGKVTDNVSQEYKDCLRALEADKMVKFAGVTQEREEGGDSMAAVSALLWDKEWLWSCCNGAPPSPRFDAWISQVTTLLKEVESNSVRRESIAYGCTPVKLNTTFCKENRGNLDNTFVLVTAASDSAQKIVLPPEPSPVQQQLPTPTTTFGFSPAATIKLGPGVAVSEVEQEKENKDAVPVFKKPVATPAKQIRKKLKYNGSPRPGVAAKNPAQVATGIRIPLKLKNQSSLGLKLPTAKLQTPVARFHPYRGPESVPRLRYTCGARFECYEEGVPPLSPPAVIDRGYPLATGVPLSIAGSRRRSSNGVFLQSVWWVPPSCRGSLGVLPFPLTPSFSHCFNLPRLSASHILEAGQSRGLCSSDETASPLQTTSLIHVNDT